MLALLHTYAIPLIATVVLPMFIKPTRDSRPLWKLLVDKLTNRTPSTPAVPGTPRDLSQILPALLMQLLNKKPPSSPVVADPPPSDEPQELLPWILQLLSMPSDPDDPTSPIPMIPTVDDEQSDVAHLVACAARVAANNPDSDVRVIINKDGVQASVEKRHVETK